MSEFDDPSVEASGPFRPPPTEPSEDVFFGPDGLRAGWGILLFVLLLLTIGLTANFLAAQGRQAFGNASSHEERPTTSSGATPPEISPVALYASEGLSLTVVLLSTFIVSRVERRPFATYGLTGPQRLRQIAWGSVWGFLCLSLLVAGLNLTGHLVVDTRLLPTKQALGYGVVWGAGFALVAVLEETLLRGYLQYTLARGLRAILPAIFNTPRIEAWAFWTAALILSVVFGLGHGSNPGESPIGLLSAGLAGLVFSLALYRSGSLWWALGFHTSWNWAQSFLYGVPDSGGLVEHRLLATHPAGLAIFSGGLTGPEGSVFVFPTLALAALIILVTIRRPSAQR